MIVVIFGFFAGGFVKYGFFPDIENPMLAVNVEVTEVPKILPDAFPIS